MQGQLFDAERALVHDVVLTHKPLLSLEIGTWKGGGSTYSIYTALKKNGSGHLHTCELDSQNYLEASALYADNHEVTVYHCKGIELLTKLKANEAKIDLALFDGSEDPTENLEDFKVFDSLVGPGAVFLAHDWDLDVRVDGGKSTKSVLLRPYLESLSYWEVRTVLTAPVSVGLVYAVKR
jgi:predicted O-methyltransferase YrrM